VLEADFPQWAICAMQICVAGWAAIKAGLIAAAGVAPVVTPIGAAVVGGGTAFYTFIYSANQAIDARCF
jgi:hypothetical protein